MVTSKHFRTRKYLLVDDSTIEQDERALWAEVDSMEQDAAILNCIRSRPLLHGLRLIVHPPQYVRNDRVLELQDTVH